MIRSVNIPLREALVQKLSTLTYLGVVIPVFDVFTNKKQPAIIGGLSPVTAVVALENQTADNNSPQCLRSDQASIQIQVKVSFNANSGNHEHSEKIMDLILALLWPNGNGYKMDVQLSDPFDMSKSSLESIRNLEYQDSTNRIFMTQALVLCQISQQPQS